MSYLSGSAPAPDRYAKATISFGATEDPYYQDFYVGPIGSDNMTYTSYDWVTTTGTAKIKNYDADSSRQYEMWFNLSMEVEDIIQDLLNAVSCSHTKQHERYADSNCMVDANGLGYLVSWADMSLDVDQKAKIVGFEGYRSFMVGSDLSFVSDVPVLILLA
jgi:hypothetical protein